jgi:peptidoglycan/xylan/chitin deacetylase (PgdA/CDA1 family)
VSARPRAAKYVAISSLASAAIIGAAFAAARWSNVLARILGDLLPFDVTWYAKTNNRLIALSFDDGPHPATTPPLLDVLSRHHAHATFFIIGSRVAGNERLVDQIVSSGNEIANHAMFDSPSVLLTARDFERDLLQTHATLSRYAKVSLFRPASGWFTPRMLHVLAAHSYRCVMGTVTTRDTDNKNPRRQARRMLERTKPGSIIVLHEGTPRRRGVIVLTDILLSDLRARGYEIVTVSDLLQTSS